MMSVTGKLKPRHMIGAAWYMATDLPSTNVTLVATCQCGAAMGTIIVTVATMSLALISTTLAQGLASARWVWLIRQTLQGI